MDIKSTDLIAFNQRAETAFRVVALRMLRDAGDAGIPLPAFLGDMALVLDISPQTVKRYVQKHGGSLGFLDVRGGVVRERTHRDVDRLAELRALAEEAGRSVAVDAWDDGADGGGGGAGDGVDGVEGVEGGGRRAVVMSELGAAHRALGADARRDERKRRVRRARKKRGG